MRPKLKTLFVFVTLFIFACLEGSAQSSEYGLYIQTYPKQFTEFTSLALDNGEPIEVSGKKTTLSFKVWNRKENAFGTVFRAITNKGKNIDLMYSVNVNESEKHYPMLVIGDQVHTLEQDILFEQWLDVSLTIDPEDGSILLDYNHANIHLTDPDITSLKSLRLAFGLCPFPEYILDNVASVNLKDITLHKNREIIREWKMALHQEDTCYDEINNQPAVGKNADWLLDKHITWKKIYQGNFPVTPMIAFDSLRSTFYIVADKEHLTLLHATNEQEENIRLRGGEFAATYPNQLMYLPQTGQLVSYNLDENLFSFLNLETQQWENKQAPQTEHKQYYWNNTQTYNVQDSTLVSFGGYGHFHYHNDLTISYPYKKRAIQKRKKLPEIHPRYSSASIIVEDTLLYVFGGRGCPSGKAELSPRNYYDLYAINLKTLETSLLWEVSETPQSGDFLPGENMIYDASQDCFYFFCTQQGGVLMRINKQTPTFEPMSLPLYSPISAQYLYTNLYYSPRESKLYAALLQAQVSGESSLQIYELNFPPFPLRALRQVTEPVVEENHADSSFLFLLIGGGALLAGAGFFFIKRRKSAPQTAMLQEKEKKAAPSEETPLTSDDLIEFHNYDLEHSSIRFFGGFRVMDREGNDITASFTPTLKALLILLILFTGKDEKGISGHKLLQLLWFDKMEESAKNNRNVYMSKLRSLLEKVGDVSILNKNGFWSIRFENTCMCDYLEALHLYRQNDSQDLEKLVELLLHGMMLPNMEIDWIDKFKSDFSNYTIDLLSRVLKRNDLPDNFRLKIADTLFQHDYINEEALAEKCRILYKQGKKGLAKTVYNSFCKEYTVSLGTVYPTSMLDLIQKES